MGISWSALSSCARNSISFLYNLSFNFVTLFHGGGTNFANLRWPPHFWGRISTLIAREDRGEPIRHLFVWDARVCYCIFDPWVPALPPTPHHPPVLHDPFVDLIWLPYICAQDAFCFHGSAWGQIQTPHHQESLSTLLGFSLRSAQVQSFAQSPSSIIDLLAFTDCPPTILGMLIFPGWQE